MRPRVTLQSDIPIFNKVQICEDKQIIEKQIIE